MKVRDIIKEVEADGWQLLASKGPWQTPNAIG